MYDSIVVISFGGPEKPDDVIPFLENVTRGRNIPRERLLEVAEHYQTGYSAIHAISPSRQAEARKPGERAAGEHFSLVFGEYRRAARAARLSLRGVLHAQ
jgi:protoheme ferro-lyase